MAETCFKRVAVVGWSNLRKAHEERKQKLADLVAPDFMPWCEVLGYDEVKAFKQLLGPPPPLEVNQRVESELLSNNFAFVACP